MNADRELRALLKKRAVFLRSKRHAVYRLDTGDLFTMAVSPSDVNASKAAPSQLRKLLGIKRSPFGKGPDRPKRCPPRENAYRCVKPGKLRDWKEQLNKIQL